jgi:N6-L-threonylcarbamoyladenine synthase
MNILAIESSCDETATAVVQDGTKVLSSIISTSHELHNKYGGILPELASREQLSFMLPVIQQAIQQAFPDEKNLKANIEKNIDAIAVTIGPGLIGSLLMGVETAKTLSFITNKPLIPVNHVLAHIYANIVSSNDIVFPAIALIVSGGHTELFLMNSVTEIKWLGGTIDDAAGEAFDKTARLLGFGNGGGLAIQDAALSYIPDRNVPLIKLPRPLIHDDTFDFSFSGLKTAIQREWNKQENEAALTSYFAYEVQEAITDVLVKKTIHAAEKHNVSSILIGGGVAANIRLRDKFNNQQSIIHNQISIYVPPLELCTDNAVVIGSYAFFHQFPQNYRLITANPSLSVK